MTPPTPPTCPGRPDVDSVLSVGRALHQAGATAGQVEATVEALGRSRGLELQCLAGPTSIHVVHAGQARLVRPPAAGIDLSIQARLSRAVSDEVRGRTDTLVCVDLPAPPIWSAAGEAALWCLLALTAAAGLGGTDGTVLSAGVLGLSVGALVAASGRWGVPGGLVPLASAAVASGGASLLAHVLPIDAVVAPLAAILVLLPGWSLTVGVGEVASGHLQSGSARLTGAFVTVLQLALGWAAGAEAVALTVPAVVGPAVVGPEPLLTTHSVPALVCMLGVAACFALLFHARARHVGWVTAGVLLARGSAQLPAGVFAQSFPGALAIGLTGAALARRTGLPGQLVTVPGVMLMVPGGALLVAVLDLVRHDPMGVTSVVDALGVSGMLVGGLLTAKLLLPGTEVDG